MSNIRKHPKFNLGLLLAFIIMNFIEISIEIRSRKFWLSIFKSYNSFADFAFIFPPTPDLKI